MRYHPLAAFLGFFLILLLAPYILAIVAILAVVWLICFLVAVVHDLFF